MRQSKTCIIVFQNALSTDNRVYKVSKKAGKNLEILKISEKSRK